VGWIALAMFLSAPLLGSLTPARAGWLVWTVVIAALPLFIVLLGYHRWRVFARLALSLSYRIVSGGPVSARLPHSLSPTII